MDAKLNAVILSVNSLDAQIADATRRLDSVKRQYEENKKIINELEPKIGQKRKRWQVL